MAVDRQVRARSWRRNWSSFSVRSSLDVHSDHQFTIDPSRAFAKEGYSVALIGRRENELKTLEDDIKASGAEVASFAIPSYAHGDVAAAFAQIHSRYPSSKYAIRAALYNAVHAIWKPFLDVTPEDVQSVTQTNIEGSFAFAHHVIKAFKNNSIDEVTGKRGILIFTGATSSINGNATTSAFAAGKFALRALSQSLAKEFGQENIHVVHSIINGSIVTPVTKAWRNDPEWEQNQNVRLNPESIAAVREILTNFPSSGMLISLSDIVPVSPTYTWRSKTGPRGLGNWIFALRTGSGENKV
ncbi:hypothetical protein VKT23_019286 [Stygiomarasmius scandens]|uniref:NAD(P)-binding protein n=1 Tax=Marasmiellus scandens TaxID=2682957 RepID=A0ABR1ILU2_9AGAR